MSQPAISARELRKVYRLYRKPAHRFLDMFGLLGGGRRAYTEHAALDGISLDIQRGEKVALIGRNGAGKSTFLKLVTGVIEPTSGAIDVRGKAHALLQIGTGFHPDFTGRENVYAYLAQLGVSGAEADGLCAEIITFSELEEYIDQPVKTYSTGMGVRLMFSTSTAITPDLLVLDEVLGVGDAYFAHKSFERIKDLCDREGTTVLLVTHDVYSAARVCDRMIWLDHGAMLLDSTPEVVISAYEDSIRRQEERRLRLKRLKSPPGQGSPASVVIELRAPGGRPLSAPVYVAKIGLSIGGTPVDRLPIGAPESGTARILEEGSAWGPAIAWQGRSARVWNNFGSVFHKVGGAFDVTGLFDAAGAARFAVDVEGWCDDAADIEVNAYLGEREIFLGRFALEARRWTQFVAEGTDSSAPRPAVASRELGVGSGQVVFTDVRTLDGDRRERGVFTHGEPFCLSLGYRVNHPEFEEDVQLLVSFHRDGVQDVCRIFCPALRIDGRRQAVGTVELQLDKLGLGEGRYTVSVGLTEPGYFDRHQVMFYTINSGMYDCRTRDLEIEVIGGGIVGAGTGVVVEGQWRVVDAEAVVS